MKSKWLPPSRSTPYVCRIECVNLLDSSACFTSAGGHMRIFISLIADAIQTYRWMYIVESAVIKMGRTSTCKCIEMKLITWSIRNGHITATGHGSSI